MPTTAQRIKKLAEDEIDALYSREGFKLIQPI